MEITATNPQDVEAKGASYNTDLYQRLRLLKENIVIFTERGFVSELHKATIEHEKLLVKLRARG